MPINLHSPIVNTFLKYFIIFVLGILVASWFRQCSDSVPKAQVVKVIVPEVKAKFEAKKPLNKPIPKWSNSTTLEPSTEPNLLVQKLIKENERLVQNFEKASDSIKQLSFKKAIQLNEFSTKFEDENLIINIDGIVQGEVKEVTPSYIIKEKKIEVPVRVKETVLRILVGGAFGLNKELNQAAYQLDLNFQNKKGNIVSAEYLKIGNQNFGMIGYKHSIINIKK